jgi:translation initiation factor 1 (eIF-1/SUI1)
MSVDCLGEVAGCIEERGVIEIIELVVKHENILRKLIKALQKCCACNSSSSGDEEKIPEDQKRAIG